MGNKIMQMPLHLVGFPLQRKVTNLLNIQRVSQLILCSSRRGYLQLPWNPTEEPPTFTGETTARPYIYITIRHTTTEKSFEESLWACGEGQSVTVTVQKLLPPYLAFQDREWRCKRRLKEVKVVLYLYIYKYNLLHYPFFSKRGCDSFWTVTVTHSSRQAQSP